MRKRRKYIKRLHSTFSTKGKIDIKEKLIDIELQLQESYKQSKDSNERKALNAIKSNPKYFYSYAKKHSKNKSRVGPLFNKKMNSFIESSKEMADLLQDQYMSVFSEPTEIHDNLDDKYFDDIPKCQIYSLQKKMLLKQLILLLSMLHLDLMEFQQSF